MLYPKVNYLVSQIVIPEITTLFIELSLLIIPLGSTSTILGYNDEESAIDQIIWVFCFGLNSSGIIDLYVLLAFKIKLP